MLPDAAEPEHGLRDEQALILARSGVPRNRVEVGRWSADVRGDELADLSFDGVKLLRAIRPVVRDRDWNTVAAEVAGVQQVANGLVLTLRFSDEQIGFDGQLSVVVGQDRLTVDFTATATQDSWTNRTGLVVLHRADDAGSAVTVMHPDGSTDSTAWPVDISPHQPFRDVGGFRWTRDGVRAELSLAGEVFETEDQRNWTDASFKTYGTPLSLPFPVLRRPGDTVHQTAVLSARGQRVERPPTAPGGIVRLTDTVVGRVPPIGLGAALYPPAEPAARPRGYAAVLVELTGDERDWPDQLQAAAEQATHLGCGLDVRIITDRPTAVGPVVSSLTGRVLRIGAFDPGSHISSEPLWRALGAAVQETSLDAQLIGGTRAHFTELNRLRTDIPADVGELTFSLTPQMHASEVPHIVDSLTAQRTVALNAVRLAEGRPVHVGPITLRRRFNAVATSGSASPAVDAERATDPLLHTGFAAAWTLGSIAALSVPGIASLTYFETAGPRGVESDGLRIPAGQLLDAFAARRELPVLAVEAPVDLAAMAVADPTGGTVLTLADLTGQSREVQVVAPRSADRVVALAGWEVAELRFPPA